MMQRNSRGWLLSVGGGAGNANVGVIMGKEIGAETGDLEGEERPSTSSRSRSRFGSIGFSRSRPSFGPEEMLSKHDERYDDEDRDG